METLTRLPRTTLLVLTSAIILAAAVFANIVSLNQDEDADVGGFVATSVIGIAATAVLLLVVVPRIDRAQRRTAVLAFGVAALVFCLIFWSMLPFALGAAAFALAAPADDAPEGDAPAPSTAGVLIALLAWLAAFVFSIIG